MADLEENYTEEDNGEGIDNNYQTIETNDGDETEEGTVEYLDLDMEVEALEEYCPEPIAPSTIKPGTSQSSVLKSSYQQIEPKVVPKYKPIRIKPAKIVPERSIMRTRSSTNKSVNQKTTKRIADPLPSASLHDAVNDINVKLANSVKSMNGREAGNASMNNRDILETGGDPSGDDAAIGGRNPQMDSLDLFFQSMAQTVLNLPSQVQAKIKMDIYKVIASAEIKYCAADRGQGISNVGQDSVNNRH